ncbi:MAG: beta-galactosidase trimerization domain-containing protein [Planctomycetes bacterium]|nr:beta-galactosidase trimerization domain-containing protein [Planctomycetota bacterium]
MQNRTIVAWTSALALAGLFACAQTSPKAEQATAAEVTTPAKATVAVAQASVAVTEESKPASAWNPQPVRVYAGPDVVQPVATTDKEPALIVAEGEFFRVQDKKGWQVVHQDDSYASHTYGGMWEMNGGLLGAPAASEGSVAVRKINVATAGDYRVWSKYQSPPYFNYNHRVEVLQNGSVVYTYDYGSVDHERFYSFAGAYGAPQIKQQWWFWGVDHDAAEAPKGKFAHLAAGPAEIRLTTLKNPAPAGDRFVDTVILTTEPTDTYKGYKPYGSGSPFIMEAIRNSQVWARFKNNSGAPAQLAASTAGHLQPQYGGQNATFPAVPVAPGQWSEWFNIASICRLAHEEGVFLTIPAGASFDLEVARSQNGSDKIGAVTVTSGDTLILPIDVAWNLDAKIKTSRQNAEELTALAKTKWRRANGGKKPEQIAYYGAFNTGGKPWVNDFKDALGYNTQLPGNYVHLKRDGYHQHTHTPGEMDALVAQLTPEQKANFRILSFGDEISVGEIDFNSPQYVEPFRAWLKAHNLTKADLGVEPSEAKLTKDTAQPRLRWYSNIFNEETKFGEFAAMTKKAETELNKDVLTGANYSPHGAAMYYGPIFQWIDIFKFRGMSAYWTEDYIFSVAEPPQMIGWMLATARCAVKYHTLPIHFYVMPHAPGQTADNLRRNMVYAIGGGATQIDSFWVAPAENYTENSVAWAYPDSFKAIAESIYDSGEVENIAVGGKFRKARVAVVLSKATDFNERSLKVDPKDDPFTSQCQMDFGWLQQTLCRKDAQGVWLSLRNSQHGVDLITEDDIKDGVNGKDILANYDVIYFSGEWVEDHAAKRLDAWVKDGGVLYACAGVGHLNQYGEPETALLKLLGLKSVTTQKNALNPRPLLETALIKPIDTITLDGVKIPAVAMKQVLTPADTKVIGTWSDGSAAVTVRDYGKGKAIAVGTLPGTGYIHSAAKVTPWARGGRHMVYSLMTSDPDKNKLINLGVDAKPGLEREVVSSATGVEGLLIDNEKGTLVTLINWNKEPVKGATISVRVPFKPKSARSVQGQKSVDVTYADGVATFTIDLTEADYVVLAK